MRAVKGLSHNIVMRCSWAEAKEAGMKGWRERAADVFTKHGESAAKMKFVPRPCPSSIAILFVVRFVVRFMADSMPYFALPDLAEMLPGSSSRTCTL